MTGGVVIGLIAAVKVAFVLVVLGAGGTLVLAAATATVLAVGGLAARHG